MENGKDLTQLLEEVKKMLPDTMPDAAKEGLIQRWLQVMSY